MSLINEALKKAQTERQANAGSGAAIDLTQAAPPVHNQPPRRRRYLWGFVLALLLVGLFSSILATFFVYQILGPEEPPAQTAQAVPNAAPETQAPAAVAMDPSPAVQAPVSTPEETAPIAVEEAPPAEPLTESPVTDVEEAPVAVVSEPPAPPARPEPVVEEAVQPGPPNPAVRTRLQELEIRGIMSGGTRVLIFDTTNSKSKAYRPGETVEGPLALKISAISQNIIEFEDYAGSKYTKSF